MSNLAQDLSKVFDATQWRPSVIYKKTTANVVNISGGKDSLATGLIAHELEVPNQLRVFADTGHEHPLTYEYLDYLETHLGPIQRVKADFTDRITKKREYVENEWPAKLMAETPGRWKALKKKTKQPEPDTPEGEKRFEIGMQNGDYVWLSARRPLSAEQAQAIVDRALSVLKPTGIPFLDLCLWKGRFPATKARFCTTELKHFPVRDQVIEPLREQYADIVSWQGVRAQESPARESVAGYEKTYEEDGLIHVYRPIHTWLHEKVFDIAKFYGIKPNPLYQAGCGRVGCMPCINANKAELAEIFQRWPEVVARIAEWEKLVSMANKRECSTLFCSTTDPMNTAYDSQLITVETHGIHQVKDWAMTSRGGRQRQFDFLIQQESLTQCSSIYAGVCE